MAKLRADMRLWSLHPQYLDAKGLVALWREGLLAQKVLEGKTKGYKHHPQLDRFRATSDPVRTIGTYLEHVVAEAERRGYEFDRSKIVKSRRGAGKLLNVTRGQLEFELDHLKHKLKTRDPKKLIEINGQAKLKAHPIFKARAGGKASWERA